MTESAPPLILEALLEAIGAQPTLRDAVIGDMAEEYALRAERDGRDAALVWYSLQAVRTAPHLIRSWSRQRGVVRQVARAVGVSYVAATLVTTLTLLIAFAVMNATGLSKQVVERAFLDLQPGVVMGVLFLQSLSPLCGGFVAARFDRRSPLLNVFTLGVVWSVALLVSTAFIPVAGVPEWWRFATSAIVLVGTFVSGLVGVWSTSSARARIRR